MSSQLGFSEIQCGGQPAQAFDELSARIFGNPVRRSAGTGILMSSQLGFSEIQCGGQPAQAFDELSARIFGNPVRRSAGTGI